MQKLNEDAKARNEVSNWAKIGIIFFILTIATSFYLFGSKMERSTTNSIADNIKNIDVDKQKKEQALKGFNGSDENSDLNDRTGDIGGDAANGLNVGDTDQNSNKLGDNKGTEFADTSQITKDSIADNIKNIDVDNSVPFVYTINFTFDSDTISNSDIDKLTETIEGHICKNSKIIVEGYSCQIGTNIYNQYLSERRAKNISEILKKMDFENCDIKVVGYGENKPISQQVAKNRRVEIHITGLEKHSLNRTAEISTIWSSWLPL